MEDTHLGAIGVAVIVYAGVFMWAGDYVARQKGRSPVEGVLFGLLLGPIGLLIVACLPLQEAATTAHKPSKVPCPLCNKSWDPSTFTNGICPSCIKRGLRPEEDQAAKEFLRRL